MIVYLREVPLERISLAFRDPLAVKPRFKAEAVVRGGDRYLAVLLQLAADERRLIAEFEAVVVIPRDNDPDLAAAFGKLPLQ